MASLGVIYEIGAGVPPDLQKSREWFEKALAAGLKDAAQEFARLRRIASPKRN